MTCMCLFSSCDTGRAGSAARAPGHLLWLKNTPREWKNPAVKTWQRSKGRIYIRPSLADGELALLFQEGTLCSSRVLTSSAALRAGPGL